MNNYVYDAMVAREIREDRMREAAVFNREVKKVNKQKKD